MNDQIGTPNWEMFRSLTTSIKEFIVVFKPLLWIALIIALAACGGAPATTNPLDPNLLVSPPAQQVLSADTLPSNSAGIKLVGKVNGEEITLPDFERALARRQQEVTDAASPDTLRADVLNQIIEQILIRQGAAAQNVLVSDEQVQTELQALKDSAGSPDAWTAWLTSNLYTDQEFTETLRSSLLTNQVRDSLTGDLEGNVRQVHARHILVNTETAAQDALARLNAGEDFVALAATLSQDETTRENGGDLGWFTQDELLVPELARAAFAMQPQQVAGPITTELGYHILQTLEFADRPVDPDRWVYIAQARFENWLRPLYESAVIERYL